MRTVAVSSLSSRIVANSTLSDCAEDAAPRQGLKSPAIDGDPSGVATCGPARDHVGSQGFQSLARGRARRHGLSDKVELSVTPAPRAGLVPDVILIGPITWNRYDPAPAPVRDELDPAS